MSKKITTILEGNKLRQISKYEEMLSDDYLDNTVIAQTKFIYEKFFNGDNTTKRQERLGLLNISYSIPLLISERLADYVGEPANPYGLELFPFIFSYAWGGYSVMKCRKVNSKFVIEYCSPDGYIMLDDGREQLLTYLLKENEAGHIERYVLVQTYTIGKIENELYRMDILSSENGAITGTQVSLNTLEETVGLKESENTGIKINPIVVTHNTKLTSTKYGDSDLVKIRSLMSSIEIQAVNIQDQLLKHLQAKLAIPVSKLVTDEKGIVDLSKLEVIGMESGDTAPKYVTNTNPLIEKSFDNIEKMIIQIASILAIPIEFFGIQAVGGAESEETKSIRLSPFIKRVERVRKSYDKAFVKLKEIAKGFNVKIEDQPIVWGSVLPKNKESEVNELSIAIDSRLISLKRAVMRYQDINEIDADEEVKTILAENASVDADSLVI